MRRARRWYVLRAVELCLIGAVLTILLLVYWTLLQWKGSQAELAERQQQVEDRVQELTDERAPHLRATFVVESIEYVVEVPQINPHEPLDAWMARAKAALESAKRGFDNGRSSIDQPPIDDPGGR